MDQRIALGLFLSCAVVGCWSVLAVSTEGKAHIIMGGAPMIRCPDGNCCPTQHYCCNIYAKTYCCKNGIMKVFTKPCWR